MTTSAIANSAPHLYHDQTRGRLAALWRKIQALDPSITARRDLITIHTNIRKIWAKMDNEMIECRRRDKTTATYSELANHIETYLKMMEREIFWQQLH